MSHGWQKISLEIGAKICGILFFQGKNAYVKKNFLISELLDHNLPMFIKYSANDAEPNH